MNSPSCDIFVAGFPCQPFSAGGTGLGKLDPRGTVVFRLITWISIHLPSIFVLENVLGLLERHSDTLYEILRLLVEIGSYEISWSILGADTHGNVPQHRQRIFICGILRSKLQTPLQWPSATPLSTQLADFIDQDGHVHREVQWPSTKTHKRNLRAAIERIITNTGENPLDHHYVIDLGCGPSRTPCYSIALVSFFLGGHGSIHLIHIKLYNLVKVSCCPSTIRLYEGHFTMLDQKQSGQWWLLVVMAKPLHDH